MQEANGKISNMEAEYRQKQLKALKSSLAEKTDRERLEELLWQTLTAFQGQAFYTVRNLEFVYEIRGNEMFVSRKDKSITRASVSLAFWKALEVQELEGKVRGPKKLNCFGASYLYPVFLSLGIMKG